MCRTGSAGTALDIPMGNTNAGERHEGVNAAVPSGSACGSRFTGRRAGATAQCSTGAAGRDPSLRSSLQRFAFRLQRRGELVDGRQTRQAAVGRVDAAGEFGQLHGIVEGIDAVDKDGR